MTYAYEGFLETTAHGVKNPAEKANMSTEEFSER